MPADSLYSAQVPFVDDGQRIFGPKSYDFEVIADGGTAEYVLPFHLSFLHQAIANCSLCSYGALLVPGVQHRKHVARFHKVKPQPGTEVPAA